MRAKKYLGQNFLKSVAIVSRMVKSANVTAGDLVLEIGPGKGILTKALLQTGANVVAIEKDFELISHLYNKFATEIANKKLFVIHTDVLKLSVSEIFYDLSSLATRQYKLVANIPYYITGEIIRKFLEEKNYPRSMTLLVQKEVGRRIVASDKKESILSLSVKIYGNPKYIETVKRSMFTPAPNVDSSVIHIENITKENLLKHNITAEKFFMVVKNGFAHKRKKLSGNLKGIVAPDVLENFKDKRAEDLALSDWITLSK